MSLFRKPSQAKIGLKVLAYGGFGVGKSTFGLTFPKIAAIDSEAGLSRYENNPNIVQIVNTSSTDDVDTAVSEIEENIDQIGTFLIDSETKIYDTMQVSAMEVEERRAQRKGGDVADATVSVKGWGKIKLINKRLQNLKIDLSSKGIHIVGISQMEDIKEKKGENYVKVGEKPSMAKGIEYDYDIVLKLFTKKDTKGEETYHAVIEKDRTGVTKRGQIIDNPSYEYWKEYWEQNSSLKERPTSFVKDVEKDIKSMESDEDKISVLIDEFKTKVKNLSKDNQTKVMPKAKELGIDNPLKTTELKKMQDLLEFINTLH
jgi:hypothetical protein